MSKRVDLLVAVKVLSRAKTRLRGAIGDGKGDPMRHHALALAIATDTVAAARDTPEVRTVLVVSADPVVTEAMRGLGVEVLADPPGGGLNPALRHGYALLRERDGDAVIGALQSDLPALRGTELSQALRAAGNARAYCADRHGTGTTLLLSAAGAPLTPEFGADSAARHACSGALALTGAWPSLRCDTDTVADLTLAAALGLGPRSSSVLDRSTAQRRSTIRHPPAR
ncbi:MAG: 2-phospho-L-lactate guanylyltransferase [Sciscionella sp.]